MFSGFGVQGSLRSLLSPFVAYRYWHPHRRPVDYRPSLGTVGDDVAYAVVVRLADDGKVTRLHEGLHAAAVNDDVGGLAAEGGRS